MSPQDSSGSTGLVAAAVSQVPVSNDISGSNVNVNVDLAARQITLTQTLTNGGSVTTAIVTLDRGTPPTQAATPSEQEPAGSGGGSSGSGAGGGGMPPQTIGIIVGCSVGVVALVLIIVLCCVAMRRRAAIAAAGSDYSDDDQRDDMGQPPGMMRPQRPWQFPRSIPPPTLRPGEIPHYHVRPSPQVQYAVRDPAGGYT